MKEYFVTGFTNFCRVFEIPDAFPSGYCSGGGLSVDFKMVDWFNPVSGLPNWNISEKQYVELVERGELKKEGNEVIINSEQLQIDLTKFLSRKAYAIHDKQYLVLCNFGFAFTFTCNKTITNP